MHNSYPKISIITVVFNGKEHIQKTIDSVYNLNYPNKEYIVIDGESTDGTVEVLFENRHKIDTIISEQDKGLYDAMNKGVIAATGEWLNFMNAGDIFYDTELLSNIAFSDYSDFAVLYGSTFRRDSNEISKPFPLEHIMKYGHVMACHQSMFFNKPLINKELYYDDSLDYSGDSELVTRMFLKGYKFKQLQLIISNYMGEGLTSGGRMPFKKKWKSRLDYFLYMKRLFGLKKAMRRAFHFIRKFLRIG